MNKLNLAGLALVFLYLPLSAQQRELILRKAENSFFLEHKVVAKDNFYSIGRLYNVSAKGLAAFNKIDMNKGLAIDQKIRVPLTDTNFTQTGYSGTPVYYKAGLNTTLSRISDAYRKVPVENLRSWNRRDQEDVAEGEKLVIGFLLSNEMPSVTLAPPPSREPVKEEPSPVTTDPIPVQNKEENKPQPNEDVKEPEPEVKTENPGGQTQGEAGYFKTAFEQQLLTRPVSSQATVTSGIFKTSSGWEDGKYYLLMDKAEPGTIVKLVNPGNNLFVYAKVLGSMSGIKLNENLDIRISNAAASVLQVQDTDKFILKLYY